MDEKLEMNCGRLLRGTHEGDRNTFTVGNGHHPGQPGRRENGPGNRCIERVPGTGGRRAAPGRPGNWPVRGGVATARPPPSHTWRGPCCILPGIKNFTGATRRPTQTPDGDGSQPRGPGIRCRGCSRPAPVPRATTSPGLPPDQAGLSVELEVAGDGIDAVVVVGADAEAGTGGDAAELGQAAIGDQVRY